MNDLQYLILKDYYNFREINNYSFSSRFTIIYPIYSKKEVSKEVENLCSVGYLEPALVKHNTLSITKLGVDKFIEEENLRMARKNRDSTDVSPRTFKKWLAKNKDEIINGVIIALIVAFIIWLFTLFF